MLRRPFSVRTLLAAVTALLLPGAARAGAPSDAHRLLLSGNDWSLFFLFPHEPEWDGMTGNMQKDATFDPVAAFPPAEHPQIPARVPGSVQDDAQRAGLIADPYVGLNSRAAEWTHDRDWVYQKTFAVPAAMRGRTARLHFEGVDHAAVVYLNGKRIAQHRGMYEPFEIDVSAALHWDAPNHLCVVVDHKPEIDSQLGYTSRVREWKARFSYKWDFSTRLVPLGIWDDVWIDFTGPARLADVWVRPTLSADRKQATAHLELTVDAARALDGVSVEAAIGEEPVRASEGPATPTTATTATGARPLATGIRIAAGRHTLGYDVPIANPRLWWPNGHGEQPLYRATLALRDASGEIDHRSVTFGLRTLRTVPNDDAPKGALPYVVEVNGKKIYLKGWNWVPADQLYGRVDDARYERLLRLARDAHVTLLRVWGGGLIEKERFYDLCDRYGILVWQELIQSSSGIDNEPSHDPAYLAYIEAQTRQIVPRRRNHAALAIWNAGNELMKADWKPIGLDHPTNVVFARVLKELDPGRPFLPSSPSGPQFGANFDPKQPPSAWRDQMHDVHGEWKYAGVVEQYRHFDAIAPLLHSEFGVEGVTNLSDMLRIASRTELWPATEKNPIWTQHGAWWVPREPVEKVWGPPKDLAELVRDSQFIQADGLRYAIEASGRRQFRTAGTFPWQYNEPWPNLGCTNAVSYFMEPRPVYWWVRKAYEPIHVSFRHEGLSLEGKKELRGEIWLQSAVDARPGLALEATVSSLDGRVLHRQQATVAARDDASGEVARLAWPFPADPPKYLVVSLVVRSGAEVVSRNVYLHSLAPAPVLAGLRQAPRTKLEVRKPDARTLVVKNRGGAWALGVWIELPGAYLDDNYLFLAPGEERTITVDGADARKAQVTAWNG